MGLGEGLERRSQSDEAEAVILDPKFQFPVFRSTHFEI